MNKKENDEDIQNIDDSKKTNNIIDEKNANIEKEQDGEEAASDNVVEIEDKNDNVEDVKQDDEKNKDDLKEKKKKDKKSSGFSIFNILKNVKLLISLLLLVVVIGFLVFVVKNVLVDKEGDITTEVSSILRSVNVKSELSVLIIPYNSIYKKEKPKKKDSDKTEYSYFSAYKGTVTFGLDFDKIKIETDESKKKIFIKLPKVEIKETQVDHNSIETIYIDKKYEKEGSIFERRKECDEDLKKKADTTENKNLALSVAQASIKNFLTPILNSKEIQYEIVFNEEVEA